MSDFRIFEPAAFSRQVAQLPKRDAAMVRAKLDEYVYPQLRDEPFFGPNIKKLGGYTPDRWRYRIGKFRAFYTIDEARRIVVMLAVELRRDAYR